METPSRRKSPGEDRDSSVPVAASEEKPEGEKGGATRSAAVGSAEGKGPPTQAIGNKLHRAAAAENEGAVPSGEDASERGRAGDGSPRSQQEISRCSSHRVPLDETRGGPWDTWPFSESRQEEADAVAVHFVATDISLALTLIAGLTADTSSC